MKTYRGFTLIELLVVIAIIAILAAILFPVFSQARAAARKATSLSNIKQIALGILMYTQDYDEFFPQSEYGGGAAEAIGYPLVQWYAMVYPYIKSGDKTTVRGVDQSWGKSGIFRAPGYPRATSNVPGEEQAGGHSYGVDQAIFPTNYENSGQTPNAVVSQAMIENVASKVIIIEKGANYSFWSYPWFHPWQKMWVGPILHTPNDPSTRFRDGVDVYTPGTPVYSPVFDSDCSALTDGAWECAAHARYRYNNACPMAFADGHVKAITKGAIKWFENIWFDRRGLYNNFSWYYGWIKGEWGPWME
jgi:prepilin-type N-terminal cleavage/methylation domain-containing protein/prepilin-type processing-associated H-X9-DG protein